MADKIKGITVRIGADPKPLSKALTSINKEIRTTQSSLKEVEKLLKLDPKNTNLLKEKQKLLADQIGKTRQKLKDLLDAQAEAKKMLDRGEIGQTAYEDLGRQIQKCEDSLEKLQDESNNTVKALKPDAEKIGQAFKDVGDKIENAGRKLAPLSGAAAAALGGSVKAASDWEAAFTGVQKTVDTTAEGYEKIASGIQDMATRTASSAEDIAGVAEVAGQLGVSADDILTFTETMVQLGDTTNLSSDEAATALARFINVTGSSQKDIDKLGSAVVELGNSFATDERSIVEMSQRLASAGTIAGLSETDILGLATAMSSVGIQAEAGGTAMTQSLTGIDKIVSGTAKDSGKKLEMLAKISGMSAEDFSKAWKKEPIKAIEAFIGGLGGLDKEGESATEILDELGMSGIRQSNMLKSLALASDVLTKATKTSNKAYKENTALTKEANKRYDTFEAQLSQTKEAAKQVGVELGEVMLPIIKDLLDGVKEFLGWFKSLDDETKKTIVTVTGLVAALAPVLAIGGKLISGIGSIVQGVGKLSGLLGGLGGPIALAVAGIAGLVTVITNWKTAEEEIYERRSALTASQEELKNKVEEEAAAWGEVAKKREAAYQSADDQAKKEKELWNALDKIVDAQGNIIKGHEEEAKVIMGELSEALGKEFELVGNQITNYKELKDSIEDVILTKKAEALLAADEENYTKALNGREGAEQAVIDAQKERAAQEEIVRQAEEHLKQAMDESSRAARVYYDDKASSVQAEQDYKEAIEGARAALQAEKDQLDVLKTTETEAKNNLANYNATIANHDKLVGAVAKGSVPEMEDAMKDLVHGFITAETGTKDSLERQTKTLLEKYRDQRRIVEETGDEMVKAKSWDTHQMVTKSIEELRKFDPQLAAQLQKEVNAINAKARDWNAAGGKTAKSYVSGVNGNMKGFTVESKVKNVLDFSEKAKVWGKDMMISYASGISKNVPSVQKAARNAATKIHAVLGFSEPEEGPLSDFHTYGPDMMKLLAQGINQSQWQVIQAAQGVASNLRATLEGTTLTAQLDQRSIPIGSGVTLNIANFNNYSDSDIRELTNEIMETAASFAARKGAVFA